MQREFKTSQGFERMKILVPWGKPRTLLGTLMEVSSESFWRSSLSKRPEILGRVRDSLGMGSHVAIPNTHKTCEQLPAYQKVC